MKKIILTALSAVIALSGCTQKKASSAGYPITPVPFTSVKVENESFYLGEGRK